jgi:hypothetical protein
VRLLVVSGVTLLLFLGAVPLAVPGVPRLHGVPPTVAAAALGLAGVACLAGLLLLARDRRARRAPRDVPMAVVARPAPSPAPRPAPPGYVAVRTRW